jgi:hypothetical protein
MASDPLDPTLGDDPPPPSSGPVPVPRAIAYGLLKETNPLYDRKLLEELDDQYTGGYTMMRKADQYLVRLMGESDERFAERQLIATYQNHFGQIVDQFASDVFSQSLTVTPPADATDKATPGTDTKDDFYTAFSKDTDGKGKSFDAFLKEILVTALKQGRAVVMVDAPKASAEVKTRADEERLGLGKIYTYELPLLQLIDWEMDDKDDLLWAMVSKVESKRLSPLSGRNTNTETFTLWTMGQSGKAEWARYEITYKKTEPPRDDVMVPLVERGTTSFTKIPLLTMKVPDGLWVGNKIGPSALEHFRRRSALVGSEARSLCAIPWVALGPEISAPGGALPSDAQSRPQRGRDPVARFNDMGYLVLGREDSINFAEPSGACYQLTNEELKELRDEMFAVNHQMAASVRPTAGALGRSGISKEKDHEVTAKVLTALGKIVRDFSTNLFEFISKARNEIIEWAAHGLDNYETYDRESVLEEAVSLDQVQIPSPTFRKIQKFTVAKRLTPDATPQEHDLMREEIDSGVDGEEEIRGLQQDATKEAILNPPPPPQPKAPIGQPPKAPAAKPPQTPAPGSKAAA